MYDNNLENKLSCWDFFLHWKRFIVKPWGEIKNYSSLKIDDDDVGGEANVSSQACQYVLEGTYSK